MGSEIIIDNFLDDFDSFRSYCDNLDYSGVKNPVDKVFYPGATFDIPEEIKDEVALKVKNLFNQEINPVGMFVRLSKEGDYAPHQAHTDTLMAEYTMILYLNRMEDCMGGTSFVIHKDTGMYETPINEKQLAVWEADYNTPDMWQIFKMCSMLPNRALIFPSEKMHRSEPVGGFGKDPQDGRLIFGMFFNL
jgi:hypothetical protein